MAEDIGGKKSLYKWRNSKFTEAEGKKEMMDRDAGNFVWIRAESR